LVGHLSPALLEHIRVYGTYTFDVETGVAAQQRLSAVAPARRARRRTPQ
jgi:hypothetical protein